MSDLQNQIDLIIYVLTKRGHCTGHLKAIVILQLGLALSGFLRVRSSVLTSEVCVVRFLALTRA